MSVEAVVEVTFVFIWYFCMACFAFRSLTLWVQEAEDRYQAALGTEGQKQALDDLADCRILQWMGTVLWPACLAMIGALCFLKVSLKVFKKFKEFKEGHNSENC